MSDCGHENHGKPGRNCGCIPSTAVSLLPPMFPIQCGPSIPWEVIAPWDHQCRANHDQSLERIAERGGLGAEEAIDVLLGQRYSTWFDAYVREHPADGRAAREQLRIAANARLMEIVRERQRNPRAEEAERQRDALLAALKSVEWAGWHHEDEDEVMGAAWPCCPSCGAPAPTVSVEPEEATADAHPGRHSAGCTLADAIAQAQPAEPKGETG